jgi:hypothetical protein
MRFINLSGLRFGRLLVLSRQGKNWKCLCDCGNEKNIYGNSLTKGATISCGCFFKEQAVSRMTTHGKCYTSEYRIWRDMIGRCVNQKNKRFKDYGGRGISVCERWRKFENFSADMGQRPSSAHSIDRINNDGNYERSNCRWATTSQQAFNRRNNRVIIIDNQKIVFTEACRKFNLHRNTVHARLLRGWSIEQAFGLQP